MVKGLTQEENSEDHIFEISFKDGHIILTPYKDSASGLWEIGKE